MAIDSVTTKNATGTTVSFQTHTDEDGLLASASSRDTSLATYGVAGTIAGANIAATPTDIVTLVGGTKIARVKSISIDGVATTGVNVPIYIIKRTAANTGGTATQPTIAKFDSTDAAADAVANVYTANPAPLGAGATISIKGLSLSAATLVAGKATWNFIDEGEHAVVLRGAAQCLAINLNSTAASFTGAVINYTIVWEEETE